MTYAADTIHIVVTAEDIEAGVAVNAAQCPIALAVRRSMPEAHNVDVSDEIVFAVDEHHLRYSLPDDALTFIGYFDHGEAVSPFEFDAELNIW